MVAPGFLRNPKVRQWLGGVAPAWTVLDLDSYNALRIEEPSASDQTMRSNPISPRQISRDLRLPITRNAVILLRRAIETDGLKLTATGNLPRGIVAEMCEVRRPNSGD